MYGGVYKVETRLDIGTRHFSTINSSITRSSNQACRLVLIVRVAEYRHIETKKFFGLSSYFRAA